MFPVAEDLMSLLDLEELDTDLFRGRNESSSQMRPALYGGQVAAQALRAAARTVPDGRMPNSLHGYFLRPGRADRPVILRVARDRDGGSFSARHVVAVQNGEVIFSMSASFQTPKSGPEWTTPRTPTAQPEQLEDRTGIPGYQSLLQIRALPPIVAPEEDQWPVPARLWCRTWTPLPDDPVLHACILAYASDFGSGFGDGTAPGIPRGGPSIDHALWFQDSLRMDDWVLLEMWPLKAGGSRGLYAGTVQDRAGRVGAMLTQEVLFRAPASGPPPAGSPRL